MARKSLDAFFLRPSFFLPDWGLPPAPERVSHRPADICRLMSDAGATHKAASISRKRWQSTHPAWNERYECRCVRIVWTAGKGAYDLRIWKYESAPANLGLGGLSQ